MKICDLFFCCCFCFIIAISTSGLAQEIGKDNPIGQKTDAEDDIRTIRLSVSMADCAVCARKAELCYTEAFKRLGYRFDYNVNPPQRGIVESNSGRLDGEAFRLQFTDDLEKQFPNLIRVDEPVGEGIFAAYSTNPDIRVQNLEHFRGKDLLIGYIRGQKAIEAKLAIYVAERNRLDITDLKTGLKMLAAGRMDVLIADDQNVKSLLRQEEFRGQPIKKIGEVLAIPVYPYLHKKYAALVPKLEAALRAMKRDGTLDRLTKKAEKEVFDK